eukprot:TRINITY_DN11926_c0_g1_i4.p1 TRINITY_DN11926_c0_g1~~TRINITY_DN11926_c0_g1_i4.p1  ORF type:complete len:320 (+),score=91.47 TRINITY_DN11926_c0_g1_i4:68-961(+)
MPANVLPGGGMVVTKDRTTELHTIFESIRQRSGSMKQPPPCVQRQQASEFAIAAQEVTRELAGASEMLGNLTKLMQDRTVFDDHAQEIQTMSVMIKERYAGLQRQLGLLRQISEQQKHWGKHQANDHSAKVVQTLQQRVLAVGKHLKDALTDKAKSMKAVSDRRANFTFDSQTNFGSSLFRQAEQEPLMMGGEQQMVRGRDSSSQYYRQRQEGVRQIEQTVHELTEMFTEFSRLVATQEEMILRIDENTNDALGNVVNAESELLKYLHRISSNKWLVLKVFGILFVFVVVFGLFVVH